jgi:hypothetical protein
LRKKPTIAIVAPNISGLPGLRKKFRKGVKTTIVFSSGPEIMPFSLEGLLYKLGDVM